jgi:hypothetical protein
MKWSKKILLTIFLGIVLIQFIRPVPNINYKVSPLNFTQIYAVPEHIQTILSNSCYDCHSNNSRYPWYSKIQPVAWILQRHINNGKHELNFSEFGNYNTRRQRSKLKDIANSLKEDMMPLFSYKVLHRDATLSQAEKSLIMDWMQNKADSLSKFIY